MIRARSESSGRRVAVIFSRIAFAAGACGGLARILMPSAVSTVSEGLVSWPARSLTGNLAEVACWPRPRQGVARRLRCPRSVRVRGGAGQAGAAGAVPGDDRGVDAPQEHGVHRGRSRPR
jgi:hypothetical protein